MPSTASSATGSRIQSLFVSDVHLGYRFAQAERFLAFLESVDPEQIYIVGDFIDGWRLRRRWHWRPVYVEIIQRLLKFASDGVTICYTPGNHDEFLKAFLAEHDRNFGLVRMSHEFIYEAADERRYLVLHGDQFDGDELRGTWLKRLGSCSYDLLVWADHQWNGILRGLDLAEFRFSSQVKRRFSRAQQFISDYENRLTEYARQKRCHGVICGHIHVPQLRRIGGTLYCNTGDWVEHCTALTTLVDGTVQLIDFGAPERPVVLEQSTPPRSRSVASSQPSEIAAVLAGDL